ncbi:hypothetical protein SS1G_12826 [Sclerotinia sclerotiorum 1980 UF-70]|uniref:Uncharacterized protein n=1 Tax=Sclerotinia sclerotiorum (strain ATCC 18683 / 1980 / Ss-1) TaxID=665079 RepID=A7F5E8_SCLS1|nr:hypothetical protein SS1G_12826 [Sclerotinia sclerotiorum 1980 UF-70]EDN97969.1 hypothetical protein SS1G_12826 [Sclerotinia sclerotiorum 1980 UF-70]
MTGVLNRDLSKSLIGCSQVVIVTLSVPRMKSSRPSTVWLASQWAGKVCCISSRDRRFVRSCFAATSSRLRALMHGYVAGGEAISFRRRCMENKSRQHGKKCLQSSICKPKRRENKWVPSQVIYIMYGGHRSVQKF